MGPISLRRILLAAFGSAMGGVGGLVLVLPLAGILQPPLPAPSAAADSPIVESTPDGEQLGPDTDLEIHYLAAPNTDQIAAEPAIPEFPYDPRAVEYLSQVGFGSEYGSTAPVLHKWTRDIKLRVLGSPTPADLESLREIVADLNSLINGIKLTLVEDSADLNIYFLPEPQFATVEPTYIPVNYGFFRVWWDHQGAIYKGRILVASQGITQEERSHLIREEVTQSLGLFRDSWDYPDSIFYQGWTATGQFSEIDSPTIQLLYQPQLLPGMTKLEVKNLLSMD